MEREKLIVFERVRQTGEPATLDGVPVLPAVDDGRHLLMICSYCGDVHAHGRGKDGHLARCPGNHVVEHCDDPVPGGRGGYWLVCVGPGVLARVRRRRRRVAFRRD